MKYCPKFYNQILNGNQEESYKKAIKDYIEGYLVAKEGKSLNPNTTVWYIIGWKERMGII